jgi:creatinine amidohydrolase
MARAKAAFEALNLPLRVAAFTDANALIAAGEVASERFGISPEAAGAHAGHVETSVALVLAPDLVGPQRERGFMGRYHEMAPLLFEQGLRAVTVNGVLGDPAEASAAAGECYLDALFAVAAEHLERQLALMRSLE